MNIKISVVINTLNESKNIERAINSVKWANEIVVCDMHSEDKTVEIAKKMGAKVIYHKKEDYVELARNFAISKASGDWILIIDPDEEIPQSLKLRLLEISSKMHQIDFVKIPRKNIIFGSWMKTSMWWPDYNTRFFKKGKVEWKPKIHRQPEVSGEGLELSAEESLAIVHHNYQSIGQFIGRMNRYTQVEAKELKKEGYKFKWQDLLDKPLGEFLSRFFANRGFEDGLHGLSLSLLQAFSVLLVYLKLWEESNFQKQEFNLSKIEEEKNKNAFAINYWIKQSKLSKNPLKRFLQKVTG